MTTTDTVHIQPILDGEPVASADHTLLAGVDGEVLAEVSTGPKLLAQLFLRRLAESADGTRPDPGIFARAGELFATAELDGEDPQTYAERFSRASGVPIAAVRRGVAGIRSGLADLVTTNAAELPAPFAVPGFAVRWVPKGRVLAAILPSNHPEPNKSWVQALSLGYWLLLRPGGRDPFTPRRLISALLGAGLEPSRVALLPSEHSVGDHLLKQADRGLLYGGPDAVRRWTGSGTVLVRGPGRSKTLVDTGSGVDPAVLDHLIKSIADDGGVRCNNISAVFTSGSVTELAEALAQRLGELPTLPATHGDAVLPAVGKQRADGLRSHLAELGAGLTDHSRQHHGGDPLVETSDGSVVHRPVVLSTDDPRHPVVGTELSFPFVVVAPWVPADGVTTLRESLVVNLLTERDDVVEQALLEPSIRKVVRGRVVPWAELPEIPHDGSLSQFLLEPKGMVGPLG